MSYTSSDVLRLARIFNNNRITKTALAASTLLLEHYKYLKALCHASPMELKSFSYMTQNYLQNFIIWRAERINKIRDSLKTYPLTINSRPLHNYCELIFKGSTNHGLRVFCLDAYHYYLDDAWIVYMSQYTEPQMWFQDVVKYALDYKAFAMIIACNRIGVITDRERFLLNEFQNYWLNLPTLDINFLGIIHCDGSNLYTMK